MPASIIAIVLNWNGRDVLPACLDSLLSSRGVDLEVLVVDNASTDGSLGEARSRFPSIETLELSENTGFCRGNNAGLEWAGDRGAEFIWLVNYDVEVEPDAACAMLDCAEKRPRAGALGPKVYAHGSDRVFLSAGGVIDRPLIQSLSRGRAEQDTGQYDRADQVDFLSGCSLLLRSSAIKEIGTFDTRYHFYWEDADLCLRLTKAGWEVWYAPEAVIWHKESYAFGQSKKPRSVYYSSRNRLLTAYKHRLARPATIRRTTRKWLQGQYLTARHMGHPAPGRILVAGLAGVIDHYRGRFGPSPRWLDSSWMNKGD